MRKTAEASRKGFSLIEVLIGLLLLEIGLLATGGMIFQAQQNLTRAALSTRAVLQARRTADSLVRVGDLGGGHRSVPWGELRWTGVSGGPPGIQVVAVGWVPEDTLAIAMAWADPPDSLLWKPAGERGGGT